MEFKLPWCEAGPPNHHDDEVVSDQQVVKKNSVSPRHRVGVGVEVLGVGFRVPKLLLF